uniref:Uncharacterized protein n=1 Tax=Arundo donax TaxID=35708 RepID=A0A0A9E4R4_ARUDO
MQRPKIPFLYLHRTCLIAIGSNCTTVLSPPIPHRRSPPPPFLLSGRHCSTPSSPTSVANSPCSSSSPATLSLEELPRIFSTNPWTGFALSWSELHEPAPSSLGAALRTKLASSRNWPPPVSLDPIASTHSLPLALRTDLIASWGELVAELARIKDPATTAFCRRL